MSHTPPGDVDIEEFTSLNRPYGIKLYATHCVSEAREPARP